MKKQKRDAATREDRSTLTENRKKLSYPHVKPNRLKKQEKLIQMNPRYFFFFKDGICHYRKKKAS